MRFDNRVTGLLGIDIPGFSAPITAGRIASGVDMAGSRNPADRYLAAP